MNSTRLRTSKWLRDNLIKTLDQREILLDKHRESFKLSEVQRQAVWVLLSDIVYSQAKKHYGQSQSYGRRFLDRAREWFELPNPDYVHNKKAVRGYETHTDRMLILAEWLRSRKDKSVGWCIVAYKRRFAQFEELRHFRAMGIGIDVADVQKKEIRAAVYFSKLLRKYRQSVTTRSYDTIFKLWVEDEEAYGRTVTTKRAEAFAIRWAHFDELMSRTRFAGSYEEYQLGEGELLLS